MFFAFRSALRTSVCTKLGGRRQLLGICQRKCLCRMTDGEHLADLLGVQAQKLLVQGCSYVLPCLLELVRL